MRRSKWLMGLAFLFFLEAGCCHQPANNTIGASSVTYLINCRLIDGTGSAPIANAVVAFEAGLIAKAGPADSIAIPQGAKVIDLKGATVMPGFINAHVHSAYQEQNLQNWLKAGVTTVRDEAPRISGNFLAERDRLNKNPAYARIVSATPILSVPGGYGGSYFDSADSASKLVGQYIKDGVDLIKISIEDDLQGRTWNMPTYEEIKAVVETAHGGNRRVSAHISHVRNLDWAIDAGVDDIAHMVVEPISEQTAQRMAQKGIYWVPTLELWNGVSKDYGLDWLDTSMENLAIFKQAGGKVALGTDFAGYTVPFDSGFPITEVTLMRQAGMTPMEIIVAATSNAAHVCGLSGTLGTVEEGKVADLLIIQDDPLALDWSSQNPFLSVRMVVHGGKIVVDRVAS